MKLNMLCCLPNIHFARFEMCNINKYFGNFTINRREARNFPQFSQKVHFVQIEIRLLFSLF